MMNLYFFSYNYCFCDVKNNFKIIITMMMKLVNIKMEEHQNDDLSVISKWVQLKWKNIAKTSLKMFFYTLVVMLDIMLESFAMMFIGSLFLLLGFWVFITTPIWTMFLFFTWIPTVIMVLVIMYSKIGESFIRLLKRTWKWLLYDSTRPRRWIWTRYYDFLSWIYPEDSFYIMNSGYALLSEDGLINKFNPLDHEKKEIYQYQLYYYVANLYGREVIADKKIVDLCCGRGGGIIVYKN